MEGQLCKTEGSLGTVTSSVSPQTPLPPCFYRELEAEATFIPYACTVSSSVEGLELEFKPACPFQPFSFPE